MRLHFIGFLLITVWLTGCTITKRVHRDGYHVEWHKRHKTGFFAMEGNHKTKSEKQAFLNAEPALSLEEMKQCDSLSICAKKRQVNSAKENHFKKETTKSKIAVSSDRVVSQEKVIRSLQKKIREENKKEEEPNRDEKIVIGANIAYLLFILIGLLFMITGKLLMEFWVVIVCILLFLIILMTVLTVFVVKDDRNLRGKYKKQYKRIRNACKIVFFSLLKAILILLGLGLAVVLFYYSLTWIWASSMSTEAMVALILLLVGIFSLIMVGIIMMIG